MKTPFTHTARATPSGPPSWRTWVGLVLVPILVMGLFLWAFWNPEANHGAATAAIVNDDRPVTVDGQVLPLGRQLAANLTTSPSAYTWVLTDADDARDGLASGAYSAVVAIPPDFSAEATSAANTNPIEVNQATVRVQTSNATGVADPLISSQIARIVLQTLNQQIVKTYLNNVYLSFNDLHDQLGQAVSGAQQLANGADRLHAGATTLTGGTGQLASGLNQAQDQVSAARTQVDALLAPVIQQLPPPPPGGSLSQIKKLAMGLQSAAGAATQIDDGARQLNTGLAQLSSGADQLATQLAEGQKKIPTFDRQQRDRLTDAVVTPAVAITDDVDLGAAVAAVGVTLALWGCAVSTYISTRALPREVLTSRSPTRSIVIRAAIPGAAVAALAATALSVILIPVLHLGVRRWLLVLGVTLLSALAFMVLNQAASAVLGRVGRLASIAVLVVTVVTNLTSTIPPTLHAIGEALPTRTAILALRGLVVGSNTWSAAALELGAWLLAGALVTLLITGQRRFLDGKRLRLGTMPTVGD